MGLLRNYEAFDSLTAVEEGTLIDGLKYLNERLEEVGIEGSVTITIKPNGDTYALIKINNRTEMNIILENGWDKKMVEYSHDFSDCMGITKADVIGD